MSNEEYHHQLINLVTTVGMSSDIEIARMISTEALEHVVLHPNPHVWMPSWLKACQAEYFERIILS